MSDTPGTIAGAIRVALFLGAAMLALLSVGLRTAGAHTSERALDLGARMLQQLGPHRRDPTRTLMLNGTALDVASGTTDATLSAVIDGFAVRCREVGPRFDRMLDSVGAPGRRLAGALPRSILDATARTRRDDRAAIACLDMGSAATSLDELGTRLERFAAGADLAALGRLRFLYAERHGGRTSYLLLHAAGTVPLLGMFPEAGDAQGRDVDDVPRPKGSRRVLSAWQRDARPLITVYRAAGAPAVSSTRYRSQLTRAGLTIARDGSDGSARWLVATRDQAAWLVTIATDGAASQVAITPL